MNYEEQMRREMEQAAKEQQCPVEDEVDAAFAMRIHSAKEITASKSKATPTIKKKLASNLRRLGNTKGISSTLSSTEYQKKRKRY